MRTIPQSSVLLALLTAGSPQVAVQVTINAAGWLLLAAGFGAAGYRYAPRPVPHPPGT